MKRTLTDFAGHTKLSLNEDANGKWIIEGEFGKADIPTANGRIYPRAIWEREIAKIKPSINAGTVFGHLNHPSDGKTNLKEVAMVMKELHLEQDGRVMGRAELCDNQWGDQYKAIHRAGGRVGVSSRGMGSTEMGEGKYSGHEVVSDDYEYMTHDLVADPAVKTSYPEVKEESKNTLETKEIVVETSKEVTPKIVEDKKEEKPAMQSLADACGEIDAEVAKAKEAAEKADDKDLKDKEKKTEDIAAIIPIPVIGAEVKSDDADIKELDKDLDKDAKIAHLIAKLELKDKEIAELIAGAQEITESAKRIGLALIYERAIGEAASDRTDMIEEVGTVAKYKSEEELTEAIKKAKKKIMHKKKEKMMAKKKMEAIEARHKEEMKKLQEERQRERAQALEAKKELAESLKKQKELAAKVYLEESIKLHPHAQSIRKICEGMTEKNQIDAAIKQLSIDESALSEYNFIQNRLTRLEAIKKDEGAKSLVENQLGKERQDVKKLFGDVDAEIESLIR